MSVPVTSSLRKTTGGLVVVVAALFAVSVSVPATAIAATDATYPNHYEYEPAPKLIEPGQSFVAHGGDSLVVERDGYDSTLVPQPTEGSYAQTASTFINYAGAVQWPFLVGVPITTDFGPRVPPCGGCSSFHKGIDMNPGIGSPVQAIAAGVVSEVSTTDAGGLGVYAVIDHLVDGRQVSSVYAHMIEGSLNVYVGQSVAVGDIVGNVGNTGQSTGPHLHFEILLDGVSPTDPVTWFAENVAAQ
ncbi:M23 family metallopeptidase [Homoserinimonas sp. OAct 916]|uniref:M23 family metallopeptidase n=1 Tax=Homoserinimonas sp. OAct 916 TaxID=2211450 RepID=UPI0013007FB1|nr:M23 family metallopeptidase [Homoserinimonas sp. OAct 916]